MRFLREPLFHFLLGGAALFLIYGSVTGERGARPNRIVVGEQRIASLAATFQGTWLRPPTQEELDALIRDFVDEEILYREALALGLDRDDLVVRRRLRQKMDFLHMDLAETRNATDQALGAFLEANADRFREPARLGFRQVFANPEEGDDAVQNRAAQLLERLRNGESGGAVAGDHTLLPVSMKAASEQQVASAFGPRFAEDLFALVSDGWQGPIASSFGLHLVRIEARTPGRLPVLAEIRERVERDFAADTRKRANQRFLEDLRRRYDVEISMPEPRGD